MDIEKLKEFVAQFTDGESTTYTDNGDFSEGRYCLFCGWNEVKSKLPVHEPDCVVVQACQLLGIEYKPEYVICPKCGKENFDNETFEGEHHLCKPCYQVLYNEYWAEHARKIEAQSKLAKELSYKITISPDGRLTIS